jgi:hypothetical protein
LNWWCCKFSYPCLLWFFFLICGNILERKKHCHGGFHFT